MKQRVVVLATMKGGSGKKVLLHYVWPLIGGMQAAAWR